MIVLKRAEHTTFISKTGRKYWVCNANGHYYIETEYGSVRKPTKEIMANIKLA